MKTITKEQIIDAACTHCATAETMIGFRTGAYWVLEQLEDKHQITPQAIEDMGLECIMNDVYCIYTTRTDDASIQISRDYNSQLWTLSVVKGDYIVSIPIDTIEDIETIFFMLDIEL